MNFAIDRPPADTFTILDALRVLRHRALLGVVVFVAVVTGAVATAWLMPVKYRSSVVLVPTETLPGAAERGGALGALGALRSLTGKSDTGVEEAVTILRSQAFTRAFIEKRALMPVLFSEHWDARAQQWKSDPKTLEDGARYFDENVRSVNVDEQTGFLTINADWGSADLALDWARGMAADLDKEMARRAAAAAEADLEFLAKRLDATPIPEVRQSIAALVRDRMESAMLAAKRENYAFRTIDPGFASKYRHQPRRALIIAAGLVAGVLLALAAIAVAETISSISSSARKR